jgi:hypothetical protein
MLVKHLRARCEGTTDIETGLHWDRMRILNP